MRERMGMVWVVETVLDMFEEFIRVDEFEWSCVEEKAGISVRRTVRVNSDSSVSLITSWEGGERSLVVETPWDVDRSGRGTELAESFSDAVTRHAQEISLIADRRLN